MKKLLVSALAAPIPAAPVLVSTALAQHLTQHEDVMTPIDTL